MVPDSVHAMSRGCCCSFSRPSRPQPGHSHHNVWSRCGAPSSKRSAGARMPGQMLLERDHELARIEEAVVATSRGGQGLLLIEGPAGIGKTALLASACELGREHGLLTLGARGSEMEAAFPFGVVRQLFAPHLSLMTARERRLALSGGAAGAGRLLAARLAGNDARTAQEPSSWFAALNSLYMFTANVAAGKPVLLAVDEAHWSDAPSLRFLLYLARRLESLPVLVALAARVEEQESDARLFGQLRSEPDLEVVRPRPLSESAVALVIERDLGMAPDRVFVTACHGATAGNPFLTRELVVEPRDRRSRSPRRGRRPARPSRAGQRHPVGDAASVGAAGQRGCARRSARDCRRRGRPAVGGEPGRTRR